MTCLAAVGSLAHLPLDRPIGNGQLDGAVIGVPDRFLDGLVAAHRQLAGAA